MKKIIYGIVALVMVTSCNKKAEVKPVEKAVAYVKFGD
ncbi:MAG: hypothetical protein RIQ59_732, partial [Bacteroidota bacterium]